jgi:plasmid stabilization system protein ParE
MVKKAKLIVVWDKPAYTSLQKVYNYIKEDSPANAKKVKEGILKITRTLPDHPEKYPPDKFRMDNNGEYRAFEKYSYRVVYKITASQILVLRLRHVKQEPKKY